MDASAPQPLGTWMTELPRLEVATLDGWHDWLRTHHATAEGVWLVYFKPASGRSGPAYGETVEEALCWGWVDNLVRRIDEGRYMRRFVPRKPGSNWSASNRKRVRKLREQGRMQPAGTALVEAAKRDGLWKDHQPPSPPQEMPPALAAAFSEHPEARRGFEALTAKQQAQYLGWINLAKREATQTRRVAQALQKLARGEPLGMV